jgi:hypothetical protein
VFLNEIYETVKLQSLLTVPDPEFRVTLRELAKKTVLEPFEEFYAKYAPPCPVNPHPLSNTTIFLAMASKGPQVDKDTVNNELSKLFST